MANIFYMYVAIVLLFHLLAGSDAAFSLNFFGILNHLPALPKPSNFLAQLFNVSVDTTADIANKFMFDNNPVLPDDIRILFYKEDGYFTLYRLSSNDILLDPNQDIKIIIHGFRSYGAVNWAETMSQSYHKIGNVNTLAIDWNVVADQGYLRSASSTRMVGNHIANWLFYNLLHGNSSRLRNVHLIGHSLGAHISGFIGKRISEITNGQNLIGRISGLDAAGPLFEFPVMLPLSLRINSQDAHIVEGYHTNKGYFGFSDEFGHLDYYISDGGPIQPGCYNGIYLLNSIICSHSLAPEIFRKTIESKNYLATKCSHRFLKYTGLCVDNEKIIMGEHSNATNLNGSFFIDIDSNADPVDR